MLWFLARRLAFMLLTMLVVSVIVFVISEVVPLDVARNILGPYAAPESVEHLRKQMGLDLPVPVRYWRWLSSFVQGDMGTSTHYMASVAQLLARRLLNSGVLAGAAFVLIMPLALLLGVVAGMRICETTVPPVQAASPTHRIACHIPLAELAAIPPVVKVSA